MPRGGDKVRMPASTAGIMQYWDEVKTKIELRPEMVIVMVIVVIILVLLLHQYGRSLLGL